MTEQCKTKGGVKPYGEGYTIKSEIKDKENEKEDIKGRGITRH